MTDAANASLHARFQRDGFVCIPGFLDPDTIESVREVIGLIRRGELRGIPDEQIYREDKDRPETLKQIQNLFRWHPLFHDLMHKGAAPDLARTLLGDEPVASNMQYFNKPPGIGQPTPPHQDGYYFMLEPCEAVTIWVALEPVDQENGCVRYFKGSHNAGLLPHKPSGTLGFSQTVADFGDVQERFDEISLPAEPGTLLAHHALMVHRADANTSTDRTREALGFIYYAARAREDKARHAAYQRDLAQQLKSRGQI